LQKATQREAQTIHRALIKLNEGENLDCDLLVIDESSMIDNKLALEILNHVDLKKTHIVFVGDPSQLPPVEAGHFFRDLIESKVIPVSQLTQPQRVDQGSIFFRVAQAIKNRIFPTIPPEFQNRILFRDITDMFGLSMKELSDGIRQWQRNGVIRLFAIHPVHVEDYLQTHPEHRQYLTSSIYKAFHVMAEEISFFIQSGMNKGDLKGGGSIPLEEITVLCHTNAMKEALNIFLQNELNPIYSGSLDVVENGKIGIRLRDRVVHTENQYNLEGPLGTQTLPLILAIGRYITPMEL